MKIVSLKNLRKENKEHYNKLLVRVVEGSDEEDIAFFSKWIRENVNRPEQLYDTFVALGESDEILGTVSLVKDDCGVGEKYNMQGVWLGGLNVKKEYRGQGIGTELCKHVEKHFKESVTKGKGEIKKINLFTDNPVAKKLYEKLGYKIIGKYFVEKHNKTKTVYCKKFCLFPLQPQKGAVTCAKTEKIID